MSNFLFPEKILRLITPLDIVAPQNAKMICFFSTCNQICVPSLKQQNKASTILSEIMLPETSNIDDVVNDQTEHKNNTPAIEYVAPDIVAPYRILKGFVSFLLAIKFEFVLEFKLFITD
jgi:hypothetical protein